MNKTLLVFLAVSSSSAFAHGWDSSRVDSHAPIGVMGDHTHKTGEWMVSLRHGQMKMDGLRHKDHEVSVQSVLSDYLMAPIEMDTEMTSLGMMYAPSNSLTWMIMVPHVQKHMRMTMGQGMFNETHSNGIGDLTVSALLSPPDLHQPQIHFTAGLSLPTGSISEENSGSVLPYGMQLGSGTFDMLLGATHLWQSGNWSGGEQVKTTIRIGRNERDYSLGNAVEGTTWIARRLSANWSLSSRLKATYQGAIDGRDDALNPQMTPLADPQNYERSSLDAFIGANLYVKSGSLKGHRFSFEFGQPLYERISGVALEKDWQALGGWQYAF